MILSSIHYILRFHQSRTTLILFDMNSDYKQTDQLTIIESLSIRNNPRKKRKLNNHQTQPIDDREDPDSGASGEYVESDESKTNSDKENAANHNSSNRRKRPRPPASQLSLTQRPLSPLNNPITGVHAFGGEHFQKSLNCQPGALVRLELVNFLCHSNFSISFHPVVNIIYGQNGSLVLSLYAHSIWMNHCSFLQRTVCYPPI